MIQRLINSLTTWPSLRGWGASALIAAAGLVLVAAMAFGGRLVSLQPHTDGWPLRLLTVMIVPAFTEELLFRGLLIPAQGESRRAWAWFCGGIAAFVAWHVVEAVTFLPGAKLFLTPVFLACAGVLGLTCAIMRWWMGSLWPAVITHGLAVFAWQVFLGGPDVKSLL